MPERWSGAGRTTIPELLTAAAEKWSDATSLDFSGDRYSFLETRDRVMQLARGLRTAGVQPGDRIASILDNSADAVFLWYASSVLNAVYVPINTDYKGEFLRHQLADSGAAIIVAEEDYVDRVDAIAQDTPALRLLVVRGGSAPTSALLATRTLDSIRSDDATPIASEARPDDLAMLIYTSGTTGPSKGCMIPQSYACNFARQNAWHSRSGPGDVIWSPTPLFHANAAFGVVLHALYSGAAASVYPRFSVSAFWPEIERSGATQLSLLSVMITLIPSAPESEVAKRCYGQVRVLYGSPITGAAKQQWQEKFGVQYVAQPAYGMTEACLVTLASCYEDAPEGSSGRRCQDFDVRVIDRNGDECPPGVPGEIIVRPQRPGVMFDGYWQRPEATAAATRNLWFHTGDIGKFDENDYFFFVDRKKDYLRRGGENISSFEVEASFRRHPEIAEVAAHAVPSELSEDELKISVILKEGAKVTEKELYLWSTDQLPHFCVPRYIEFRTGFPTTPTGKIQKHVLRSEGVTTTTWDRTAAGLSVPRRRRLAS